MNLASIIAIVVIGIIVILAALPLVRRMRSRETCCGEEKPQRIPRKKLKCVSGSYKLKVEGMHCSNCVRSVTTAINSIEGVAGRVNLETGVATISYESEPHEKEVIGAIAERDFLAVRI